MNPCRTAGLRPHRDAAMVRRRRRSGAVANAAGERIRVVDIFDEVEEDLRAERAKRLLEKYAWLLIAVVVAIVGGASGWQLWNRHKNQQDAAVAASYVAVQSALDQPGAANAGQLAILDK